MIGSMTFFFAVEVLGQYHNQVQDFFVEQVI